MDPGIQLHVDLLSSFAATCIIPTVIKYNIAEKLESGAKTLTELCDGTPLNPVRLARCLTVLSHQGIFSYDSTTGQYSNTSKSLLLTGDFYRAIWLWHASSYTVEHWSHVEEVVTSTKSPQELQNLPPIFEDIKQRPETLSVFQGCMAETTKATVKHIIPAVDLSGVTTVMDVGGGDGSFALELARANPHVSATCFDRPEVRTMAEANIAKSGLADRVGLLSGSFLESVPAGFEAITLKHILHDWDDEHCLVILRNCRSALNAGAKLFVFDAIIEKTSPAYGMAILADVFMMMLYNSRERTQDEFAGLLAQTGFRVEKSIVSALEGVIMAVAV
jgi:predicted O-methyltransferase YrrM